MKNDIIKGGGVSSASYLKQFLAVYRQVIWKRIYEFPPDISPFCFKPSSFVGLPARITDIIQSTIKSVNSTMMVNSSVTVAKLGVGVAFATKFAIHFYHLLFNVLRFYPITNYNPWLPVIGYFVPSVVAIGKFGKVIKNSIFRVMPRQSLVCA